MPGALVLIIQLLSTEGSLLWHRRAHVLTCVWPCRSLSLEDLCHLWYCWYWQGKKHSLTGLQSRPSSSVNHSNCLTCLKITNMHTCTCRCAHKHVKNAETSWVIEDLGLGPGYFLRLWWRSGLAALWTLVSVHLLNSYQCLSFLCLMTPFQNDREEIIGKIKLKILMHKHMGVSEEQLKDEGLSQDYLGLVIFSEGVRRGLVGQQY